MDLDDELCLCFHVTRRKVENFIRLERPKRLGQMADCYGAGTGCGWCRPFLKRLFEATTSGSSDAELPSPAEYALGRTDYVRSGHGTPPPGATPIGE
jgi:NAD(P)H-nitrite reductase large subunit